MEDEYADEAPEAPEETSATDDGIVKKLKQENQSLRQRLRRSELEGTFGKDVVELIPEELPISKWEDFATKLQERLPKAATQEPDAETSKVEPEEPSQEDEPTALAAVTQAPANGNATAGELLTTAQIKELAKTDPVRANQLVTQGKFQQAAPL